MHKPCIGLALGSGSARGWAHIGVIRALDEEGIRPDIVCGTSIGALVGAAYAAGELDRLEQWVRVLGVKEVVGLMDVSLTSGLLKGERLMEFFRRHFTDRAIEDLPIPFAAVATSLQSGAEIWLRTGSTLDAVRASIALPGLFTPVLQDDLLLADGGLVNPVPVSVARALGADVLIAVDLGSDILGRRFREDNKSESSARVFADWIGKIHRVTDKRGQEDTSHFLKRMPSMLDVVTTSINIMQVRIARSRMAGEPPDIVVTPRLAHLGLLDFHKASEAIEEGRRAVERISHTLALFKKQ
jgi:NTE family protein